MAPPITLKNDLLDELNSSVFMVCLIYTTRQICSEVLFVL